ncbi:MAG: aminotransferase class I and II [Flavobacterium sp.]|nr:MAG: aminotransferase class I and II [Flavobacterium sp.]
MNNIQLRTVNVTRYVTPLREGGSMPAIAEADDNFLYVLKFRGAGQGTRALIAELIGGEIARLLGLKVPELVFANLDEAFGRTEPDEEIQDLLKASVGLNLALHYLSGAITFDPTVTGASLYFHHSWQNWEEQATRPFFLVKDHVLLPWASELVEVDQEFRSILNAEKIQAVINLIPDNWLEGETNFESKEAHRQAYNFFLETRLANSDSFLKEAQHAREILI